MAGSNRRSLGAVRFDLSEIAPSLTISPTRRRRSIAAQKIIETNIEENDDEAERLARREKNETSSPASTSLSGNERRPSAFGLSAISNLSSVEMSNQIAQCIKLSAENKINDKNAFQLKMIDFLVYTLKKQDPNMTNLQMASASLDASAKIYGFRVDKVHSDLLKIIGMVKQDKRDLKDEKITNENINNSNINKNDIQQKKTKRKSLQHIISKVEALKGNLETYDPLSLIRCQRDTQTSDMLFQAGLPQHASHGVALNLYNDVILDKISMIYNQPLKISTYIIDDFTSHILCPSYSAFKFLDWSPDIQTKELKSQINENDGEYHFDLDAIVADDDVIDSDTLMDCGDAYEERCDKLVQNQHIENIVDFQDIIANNPNPNATYEYSYLQKSYRIHWAGPSHWKIILNKNLGSSRIVETCKQNITKKKKEIQLVFTKNSKEESKSKFNQINRQTKLLSKTTKIIWSADKVTFPQDIHYDLKRYYIFFNKPIENLKFSNNEKIDINANRDNLNYSDDYINSVALDNGESFRDNEEEKHLKDHNLIYNQESTIIQSQGAFIGDNLVSIPKLTDKIFIPYSQRAKKIDMRQLKKAMWKNIKKTTKETEKENFYITQAIENENKAIEPKAFSDMYLEIPKILSKLNADSLSPAIAFVSLLHLANEKNLKIDRNIELSDFIIKCGKNNL
ncbi:PREDICTED: condensin complex subunit 2 [Ceratosolen solmsi marchali]|uniref:Condensin complex subunit 2 n=1 Tax=Ceratosolen solmsi marchali TaxID=326594 RepID=A0AAJ6YSZ1_9HYME|nr:PREDICTED: condensin complex subunit 2 [Ceratosolen solmsi marchali]XP_011503633.1 PREDICTED: condensin complex subunit 2 [Ceratosolen solmsi marchali]